MKWQLKSREDIKIASEGQPKRQMRDEEDWADLNSTESGEGKLSRQRRGGCGCDIAVKIVTVGRLLTLNVAHQKMQLASTRVDG